LKKEGGVAVVGIAHGLAAGQGVPGGFDA